MGVSDSAMDMALLNHHHGETCSGYMKRLASLGKRQYGMVKGGHILHLMLQSRKHLAFWASGIEQK